MPATGVLALSCAPLLATAILLLATARAWRTRRLFVELVVLALTLGGTAAALAPLPSVVFRALLPIAAVVAAWVAGAHAEWRFAPDRGQRGFAWAWTAAAGRTALLAFGAILVVAPVAWLPVLR